jgi:hypothetical protein
MIEDTNIYIGTTKDWEEIYLKNNGVVEGSREWYLSFKSQFFDIINKKKDLMGTFQLDYSKISEEQEYFDVGDVETAKYGYANKWIASSLYIKINELLYNLYEKVLFSDRNWLSWSAFILWKHLESQWKAIYLWLNTRWGTHFDSKPWPTPMFKMKEPA